MISDTDSTYLKRLQVLLVDLAARVRQARRAVGAAVEAAVDRHHARVPALVDAALAHLELGVNVGEARRELDGLGAWAVGKIGAWKNKDMGLGENAVSSFVPERGQMCQDMCLAIGGWNNEMDIANIRCFIHVTIW